MVITETLVCNMRPAEQIRLSPPDGAVKLLLGEHLLAPSQTHPVTPFGSGFGKLSAQWVRKWSWRPC